MILVTKGSEKDAATYEEVMFSQKNACPDCGISIPELQPRLFSFNNPFGACPECTGLGEQMEFDEDLMIPDKTNSFRIIRQAHGIQQDFRQLRMHIIFHLILRSTSLQKNSAT